MAKLSADMRKAFECLGVSPDADAKIIRAAWKKLVRAYHPDLYKNNQAEGNRRLAELNAAFDLISSWSTEEANAANQAARARQAERMHRTAAQQRAAAERAAAERKKQAEADARVLKQQRQAAAARKRAAELDREDALRRARKASERRCASPSSPHHRFMSALSQLAARPANRFSFSM
ncbi:MAG: J domain-containing protein [Pseudomonadota bacterium]